MPYSLFILYHDHHDDISWINTYQEKIQQAVWLTLCPKNGVDPRTNEAITMFHLLCQYINTEIIEGLSLPGNCIGKLVGSYNMNIDNTQHFPNMLYNIEVFLTVMHIIKKCNKLTALDLSDNWLVLLDDKNLKILCDTIEKLPNLTQLNLSSNLLKDWGKLDRGDNKINIKFEILFEAIKNAPRLKEVYVADNGFDFTLSGLRKLNFEEPQSFTHRTFNLFIELEETVKKNRQEIFNHFVGWSYFNRNTIKLSTDENIKQKILSYIVGDEATYGDYIPYGLCTQTRYIWPKPPQPEVFARKTIQLELQSFKIHI